MTELELKTYRQKIKKSILHYLTDDWNNHKRGKAHEENVALYDKEDGYSIWVGIKLNDIMEKVVKGIWSIDISDINDNYCEWKQSNISLDMVGECGGYVCYSTEIDFIYCPYCGNKIKYIDK